MVILNAIWGERVYLDTNIFIYALEGYPDFVNELTELFEKFDEGNLSAVTSELTLAEVLVRPFIDGNIQRQTAYQQALQSSEALEVVPVNRDVLIEAARLRSVANLRLPDAIHGATARLTGCETFLTNDRRLLAIPDIEVVLLSEALESSEFSEKPRPFIRRGGIGGVREGVQHLFSYQLGVIASQNT